MPAASVPLKFSNSRHGRDADGHLALQLSAVCGEADSLGIACYLGTRLLRPAVFQRLFGHLLPSPLLGMAACLPAPVPYASSSSLAACRGHSHAPFSYAQIWTSICLPELLGRKRVVRTKKKSPPRSINSKPTRSESPHEALCLLEVGSRSLFLLQESGM